MRDNKISKDNGKKDTLNLSSVIDNHSIEKKSLTAQSHFNRTVGEITGINAADLKNPALLSKVAEKLRSQKDALGQQLVRQRMHDSAWIQHTNTIKECIGGLELLKSLKILDPLSARRHIEDILGSRNKKLAQSFQEAKQMLDQMEPFTMSTYQEIGRCLYKINQQRKYLENINKLLKQAYSSIHREVKREDRTIGQAELEAYRKQVAEVLETCSKAETSFAKMRDALIVCEKADSTLKEFKPQQIADTEMSISTISSSIEKVEKVIREYQRSYFNLREKIYRYQPSQDAAFESIPSAERVKIIETTLKEYYPKAARDMPETLRALAAAKDTLMDLAYCDKTMVELQNEMKKQGVPLATILQNSEREQGYGNLEQPKDERKTYVNATHFLKPHEFSELAKNGLLTFDAGVTLKHGPYSHRLQLNILAHAYKQGKIEIDPVKLYKDMTDQRFINKEQSEYTIWVDIFDGFKLPRALAVAGLAKDPSAWQRMYRQGYSDPEFVTERLIKTHPPGPLKKELALTRLRQLHFGLDSVVDADAPIVVTTPKGISLDSVVDADTLSKRIQSKVLEIEQDKINKINTFTGEYKDRGMLTKENQLQEELKGMNLEQLEQCYIALDRRVPAYFDLEGDYGKARDRIIQENGSI